MSNEDKKLNEWEKELKLLVVSQGVGVSMNTVIKYVKSLIKQAEEKGRREEREIIQQDLCSVLNVLQDDTDKIKVINFINKYLIKNK